MQTNRDSLCYLARNRLSQLTISTRVCEVFFRDRGEKCFEMKLARTVTFRTQKKLITNLVKIQVYATVF